MSVLWTIIIGFIVGVIAKFIMPGSNEPSGFILTTILGIVGAFVATYLGQALGWYQPGEGAGLIGAVVASCWGIRWSMEQLARAPGGRSGGQCLCFAIAAQAQRVCRRQQRAHLFQLSGRHAARDGLCRP